MPAERQDNQRAILPGHTHESEVAIECKLKPRTLRLWRQRGKGPPFVKIGRNIFYNDESRAAWLKSQEVQPTR